MQGLTIRVMANPVDNQLMATGIKQMLPVVLDALKADPTGALFGGRISPDVVREMFVLLAQHYKIPADIFPAGWDTATTNKVLAQQMAAKAQNAADKLAEAEQGKAAADLQRATNEAFKIAHDVEKQKQELGLKAADITVKGLKVKDDSEEEIMSDLDSLLTAMRAGKRALGGAGI